MTSDLISRSALLKAFENNIDTDVCQEDADYQYLWGFSWETVESAIQAAPAVDAVAVVRCKDCAWCKKPFPEHFPQKLECMRFDMEIAADEFCSRSERRDDNDH